MARMYGLEWHRCAAHHTAFNEIHQIMSSRCVATIRVSCDFFCVHTPQLLLLSSSLADAAAAGDAMIKKPHKKCPCLLQILHTWEIESHITHDIITLKWIEIKPHSFWRGQQQQQKHQCQDDMMLQCFNVCWRLLVVVASPFFLWQKVSQNWNLSNGERRNCHIWRASEYKWANVWQTQKYGWIGREGDRASEIRTRNWRLTWKISAEKIINFLCSNKWSKCAYTRTHSHPPKDAPNNCGNKFLYECHENGIVWPQNANTHSTPTKMRNWENCNHPLHLAAHPSACTYMIFHFGVFHTRIKKQIKMVFKTLKKLR